MYSSIFSEGLYFARSNSVFPLTEEKAKFEKEAAVLKEAYEKKKAEYEAKVVYYRCTWIASLSTRT